MYLATATYSHQGKEKGYHVSDLHCCTSRRLIALPTTIASFVCDEYVLYVLLNPISFFFLDKPCLYSIPLLRQKYYSSCTSAINQQHEVSSTFCRPRSFFIYFGFCIRCTTLTSFFLQMHRLECS